MNDLLEAALQYAGRGWRVIPLWWPKEPGVCACPDGAACTRKHPRIKTGKLHAEAATTNQEQIAKWWRRWPQANVGIVTGAGLCVVDVDGTDGVKLLAELVAAHGALPPTLVATTGREGGGLHLYYNAPDGAPQGSGGGLDCRGDGGFVAAPPSRHLSGAVYRWVNPQSAMGELPGWLREWFEARRSSSRREVAIASKLPDVPGYLKNRNAPRIVEDAARGIEFEPASYEDIAACLEVIPNLDLPWDDYNDILMATWASGGDATRPLAENWARKSKKYEETGVNTVEYRFRDYQRCPPKSIGFGSLVWKARHAVPGFLLPSEKVTKLDGHKVNGHKVNGHTFHLEAAGGPIFIDLNDKGKPRPTCVNSRIALQALGVACRHDKFHDKLEVGGQILGQWAGELTDNTVHMLRVAIHQAYRFDPGTVPAHDAAVQECLSHGYDPVADYLGGLEWDRKPRLENWMMTYLGAEPSRLNSAIGMLGLIAACRRVRVPGAKFDAITVLISKEGHGKSSAIEVLAGENNFSDATILNVDERQQQEAMQGVWLYEIADLAGMSKADTDKVKAFASRRIDRARPAYARSRIDRPRRCVFYATTNLDHFLKSQTGNRRFWPVPVGRIRLDELARDRDQLWAEASAMEKTGVPLGLPEALWSEAAAIQLERMEIDPWDDALAHMKMTDANVVEGDGLHKEWRIATRDILSGQLSIPPDRQTDGIMKRLSHAMRRLGWDGPKKMRIGAYVVRGFAKTCST